MLVLAPKLRVPYPIILVLGGLALGFVPGLPEIDLPPDLVLVGVLPPLLYGAAFFTSLRDLRANLRPVGLLAVGLVLLTMVVVAVVAHEIVPGLPWAAAFVLGAVVSPTDPIAATAIMQRLGVPRRIVVDRRGREPGQRRHRARRVPRRGRRGGQRHVLALGGGSVVRAQRRSAAWRSASPSAGSCARCAGGSTSRPQR